MVFLVNERMAQEVLGLAFRAVRFGEAELERVIRAYLAERGKGVSPVRHGRVSIRRLMELDQGAKMVEIAPEAVRGFQRVARKYNVDFAITKDKAQEPPMFQVFFKARDEDVIMKAFNEFVNLRERRAQREGFSQKLERASERAREINAERAAKVKEKVIDRALG